MLRKIFLPGFLLCTYLFTEAQQASIEPKSSITDVKTEEQPADEDKKPAVTFTGSADAYFRYDFAKTTANNFTSFTNSHNSFALGMASLKAAYGSDKTAIVIDLGFGTRATEFTYNDNGIAAAIKQLYVSYAPADWVKFTAGSWATHVGYELLDPQLNRNYSMSYMFTNGPFSHTGVKADITKGKHGFMLGVSNATDYRMAPEGFINKKFVIAQYSVAPTENISVFLNYVGGKAPDTSKVNQLDLTATATISDKFSLGLNTTVNSTQFWDGAKNLDAQSWWGTALYLNADPKSWLGLTLRGEYFNDDKQLKMFGIAPAGGSIFATTLSANFKSGGFTFIPEIRMDHASEAVFIGKNGAAKNSFGSFLFAAVYSF